MPDLNDTVNLIDRPGMAQTVLMIGHTATAVNDPWRYALGILTDKLGGRINSKLRDDKAYSYGFSAQLERRKGPGPLIVNGSVEADVTKEALGEVFKLMSLLTGEGPVTEDDIAEIQGGMIPPWFDRFETIAGVASELGNLVSLDLPDGQFLTDQAGFDAVTKTDVDRVARQYLIPERMTILVVGDRSRIEAPLRSLPLVKTVRLLDSSGHPFKAAPESKPTAAGANIPRSKTD